MSRWPKDTPQALKAFYGDPAKGEVERQLVLVTPPFKMTYEGHPVTAIRFHKKAASALQAALDAIWEHYGHDQAAIDRAGISKYAGSYNKRLIRGSATRWSNHAFGAAIDLNADENGLGQSGNMPPAVIAAFKAQGAKWGGNYVGRKDPMHFEFVDNGEMLPVAFMDVPDSDSDQAEPLPEPTAVVPTSAPPEEQAQQIQNSADSDAETRTSWIVRKWRGLLAWASGFSGFGFLAYLTDWRVVVALGGMTFLFVVVLGVSFIWFMGPGEVRAWIRKQVA